MYLQTRKAFLKEATLLAAGSLIGLSFTRIKQPPKLSFSTLACPDWSFDEIINFASAYKYKGIELRGIKKELDLTKVPELSATNRANTLRKIKELNLKVVNLGSSATLHFSPGAERDKNIVQGKQFIDLAQELECPYIRVYPNNFLKEREKSATMELIADGLRELGEYAKSTSVKVLIETHGDLVWTADIETLMKMVNLSNVGIVWDFCNMWTISRENVNEIYPRLKPYIHHTHIKDAKLVDNKPQYVFLGKGEVPIIKVIDLLQKDNYKGFYSFEWEKLWHPELPDPELALADYVKSFPIAKN
jgi:sugar phosphate isomerase/epimerase